MSCFGFDPDGATWQDTCCAHGSTHCGELNVGIFKSRNTGGVPNPSDPEQLTTAQRRVSVTTKYEGTSSFEVLASPHPSPKPEPLP